MSSRKRVLGLLSAVLVVLGALLLPVGAAQADGPQGSTPPGKAWIRAGHFAAGLGAVDVQLAPQSGSGSTVTLPVAYGSASAYRQLEPGTYAVSVRPQGAVASSAAMLSRTLTVESGKASTVAVLGKASAPRLAILTDDLTPPDPGTARVRVLSGSANAPDVTVMAVGGPTIASGVVLGQTTAYASVPQGTWTISLDSGDATAVKQTVDLVSGGVYTAVVLDQATDKVRLSLVTDAQGVAATPQGAAETGFGGAAGPSRDSGQPAWLLALVGATVLMGGAGVVGAKRRSRGPVTVR